MSHFCTVFFSEKRSIEFLSFLSLIVRQIQSLFPSRHFNLSCFITSEVGWRRERKWGMWEKKWKKKSRDRKKRVLFAFSKSIPSSSSWTSLFIIVLSLHRAPVALHSLNSYLSFLSPIFHSSLLSFIPPFFSFFFFSTSFFPTSSIPSVLSTLFDSMKDGKSEKDLITYPSHTTFHSQNIWWCDSSIVESSVEYCQCSCSDSFLCTFPSRFQSTPFLSASQSSGREVLHHRPNKVKIETFAFGTNTRTFLIILPKNYYINWYIN